MSAITFATGNHQKFLLAKHACDKFGIPLIQDDSLDIPEVQSEDGMEIAKHKASVAFSILQKPVVITDDTWAIPALKGFPGPYMKAMDKWFTTRDWQRLLGTLSDRRIFIVQCLVYQDEIEQVAFQVTNEGLILDKPRGKSAKTIQPLLSFNGGKNSVAELMNMGKSALTNHHSSWDELGAWWQKRQS